MPARATCQRCWSSCPPRSRSATSTSSRPITGGPGCPTARATGSWTGWSRSRSGRCGTSCRCIPSPIRWADRCTTHRSTRVRRSGCGSSRPSPTGPRRRPPPCAWNANSGAGGSGGERRKIGDCPDRGPPGSVAMQYPEWIWHNGAIKPWAEATTHVMAHALHYGSSVFEGIRSYETPDGPVIFRLGDHARRLFASARIYEMALPYTQEDIDAACREVLRRNGLSAAYLRPVAWRGLGGFGLSAQTPIEVAVAAWPMGPYLGEGVLENGIDACVSSRQRFAPNTIPAGAKAGGNYLSGQLVAREARRLGFGEGIALASTGLLSEGAGENIFMVFEGALHTPPVSAALLNGITRHSIITLARDAGIAVAERALSRASPS